MLENQTEVAIVALRLIKDNESYEYSPASHR
jgi:hypothetical protein